MTPLPSSADVIAVNHVRKRSLWAHEHLARRAQAPDAESVASKRAIDRHNQARNDAIERIDEFLLPALGLVDPATLASALPRSKVAAGARLNNETAGSMLDRVCIQGLKVAAMREQTLRSGVDEAQRLVRQCADRGNCYDQLLAEPK